MKKLHFGKRLISLGLTLAMMLTSAQFALPVQGAVVGYFRQEVGTGQYRNLGETDFPQVVVGSSLDYFVQGTDLSFDTENLFLYDPAGADTYLTSSYRQQAQEPKGTVASITVAQEAVVADQGTTVLVTPQLLKYTDTGSGTAGTDDIASVKSIDSATGVAKKIAIVGDVSLQFNVTISSNEEVYPEYSATVGTATGRWNDYFLNQPIIRTVRPDGNLQFRVENKVPGKEGIALVLSGFPKVEPTVDNTVDPPAITHNTKTFPVTIKFSAGGPGARSIQIMPHKKVNELFLTEFLSPRENLNSLLTYPSTGRYDDLIDTDPNLVTDAGFSLARTVYMYGAKFEITWALANNADAQYVQLVPGNALDDMKRFTIQKRPPQTTPIHLVGTIHQIVPNKGTQIKLLDTIPFKIELEGEGLPPKTLIKKIWRYITPPGADTYEHTIDREYALSEEKPFPSSVDMDAFPGQTTHPYYDVTTQEGWGAYYADGYFNFGTLFRSADSVRVTVDTDRVVGLSYGSNLNSVPPALAVAAPLDIPLAGNSTGRNDIPFRLQILPSWRGKADVKVTFEYLKGGEALTKPIKQTIVLRINDHNPTEKARLVSFGASDFDAVAQDGHDTGFTIPVMVPEAIPVPTPENPDNNTQEFTLTVDWYTKSLTFAPTMFADDVSLWKDQPTTITFNRQTFISSRDVGTAKGKPVTIELPDPFPTPAQIVLSTPAEDGITSTEYIINLVRSPRSSVATLNDLQVRGNVKDTDGKYPVYLGVEANLKRDEKVSAEPDPAFQPFDPTLDPPQTFYQITIPYAQDSVKVSADINVKALDLELWLADAAPPKNWWDRLIAFAVPKDSLNVDFGAYDYNILENNTKTVYIGTRAQDEETTHLYTLEITRLEPSHDITAAIKAEHSPRQTNYQPVEPLLKITNWSYSSNQKPQGVPFVTTKVRLSIVPNDQKARFVYARIKGTTDAERVDWRAELRSATRNGTEAQATFTYDWIPSQGDVDSMVFETWIVTEDGREIGNPDRDDGGSPYEVTIYRNEPSRNASLKDLIIAKNVADTTSTVVTIPPDSYKFNIPSVQTRDYAFKVLYETDRVYVTPIPNEPDTVSSIRINGTEFNPVTSPPREILLAQGKNTIAVEIVAEDGTTKETYTVTITREPPSSNALLDNLTVTAPAAAGGGTGGAAGGEGGAAGAAPTITLTPTFTPGNTGPYHISIPEGVTTVDITAKAQDKYAMVEILQDGELLATGTGPTAAGGPVTVTYSSSMVGKKEGSFTVRVTAQDGSVREYIINYTNINYMKLSEDALLQDLMTDYGDLAPRFTPTIFSYDLAVKPDAERVGFTPRVRTPSSVIKVYREGDTRQIPPLEGKYWSQFLYYTEPEVVFNFIVFSQAAQARLKAMGKDIDKLDATMVDDLVKKGFTANGTVEEFSATTGTDTTDNIGIRVYRVRVFVETDETQYDLKPITVEQIDLTADPIIVDITKYAVIQASVFATLKTDHADKTVLLKGNDYTLEFKAKDININVPHTDTFDFRMQFSTPDKIAIQDILNASVYNDGIVPVYMYSDYHGTLPAPMLLTVNLGRQYANNQLYWNYYNQERTRIDYYGFIFSNAKGSFSVPVDHFSTYLITDQRIYNAENKSGVDYGGVTMDGADNLGLDGSGGIQDLDAPDADNLGYGFNKENPETGVSTGVHHTAQASHVPQDKGDVEKPLVLTAWHEGFRPKRRRWRLRRRSA